MDRKLISFINTHETGLDTNVLMPTGNPVRGQIFFANLRDALQRTSKQLWMPEEVILEIDNMAKKPEYRENADNAHKIIAELCDCGKLLIYSRDPQNRGCAKAAFINIINRVPPAVHVGIISQSGRLVKEIKEYKQTHPASCQVDYMRVNERGFLSSFNEGPRRPASQETVSNYSAPIPGSTAPTNQSSAGVPCDEVIPLSTHPTTGDRIQDRLNRTYTLGKMRAYGSEATIYDIEEDPAYVIKLFEQPTTYKARKAAYLSEIRVQGAILPEALLYSEGKFVGYLMRKVNGVSVSALESDEGLALHAPSWNRVSFVRVAKDFVKTANELSTYGIMLGDISPDNIMIEKNAEGILDPGRIACIDIDSAQIRIPNEKTYPADGVTPIYTSPRILTNGLNPGDLRENSDFCFSVLLMTAYLCLGAVHPFRACREDDRSATLEEAIRAGEFPFGTTDRDRAFFSLSPAQALFSNMPVGLKQLFMDTFQAGNAKADPAKYPVIDEIAHQLNNYLNWITAPVNLTKYPEIQSLHPQHLKPYYVKCTNGCGFFKAGYPGLEEPGDAVKIQERWLCPTCAAALQTPTVPAYLKRPAPVYTENPPIVPVRFESPEENHSPTGVSSFLRRLLGLSTLL